MRVLIHSLEKVMAIMWLTKLYTTTILWCCYCCFFNIPAATCMVANDTDHAALVAFKAAINQDPFGALSSWNDSVHYCDWNGILCSRRHPDRVIELNLTSQGLVGSLSPHIGNLSFLKYIDLRNNNFYGPIPQEMGALFRLQFLRLENNSFGGQIPNNLSRCSNLQFLSLISNNLTGNIPAEIGSLSKLRGLGLGKSKLSGIIPPSIGNLSSLSAILLMQCNLQGEIPGEISKLRGLKFIQFSQTNLSGEIPLGLFNISTIFLFKMSFNRLEGSIPPDIGFTLPNLIFLNLADNFFTGMIPRSLSNASKIQQLNLNYNNFTGTIPKDLGKLSGLTLLNFYQNHLHDDLTFVSSLTNCTRLNFIIAGANRLEGLLPDSIGNLSTHTSIIVFDQNQLHGTIPSSIENLQNLSVISVESNYLTGPIPSSIGRLHKLQDLFLEGNKFTELPSSLGNLTLLNLLYLGQNNIRGNIPQSLGNCRNLLALDLSHNNLSGLIPHEIMSLSSISISFSLAHNSLSGSLPLEVGSLKNLGMLDVSNNQLSGLIPNSLGSCLSLEELYMEDNLFEGEIPQILSELRGLRKLDLSSNNLSGLIPSYLGGLNLEMLNLSFNVLHGEVPIQGVFQNGSAISVEGNIDLCGGITELDLPPCPSSKSSKNKLSQKIKMLLFVVVALAICFTLGGVIIIFRRRCLIQKEESSSMPLSFKHQFLRVSYAQLFKATNGFSEANLIGFGSYASVYKGTLYRDQMTVAVKVLNLQLRGALKSFMSECKALRDIRHRNLLKIVSACSSVDFNGNEFKAIVYEFMANGNLDKWLHQDEVAEDEQQGGARTLKLNQRLDISIDIASAIEYLHCGCESTIIHGDLKPSNVLLDEGMTAHVGDFGLAKIISASSSNSAQCQSNTVGGIRGTIGYVPPEYGMGQMASTLGDVYSYGILLLEVFTGKKPTDGMFQDHLNLHNFVKNALPNHRVMEIVDPSIILMENTTGSWIEDCMVSIMKIGVACSMGSPGDRMEIGSVVSELHKIKKTYKNEGLNQDYEIKTNFATSTPEPEVCTIPPLP